MYREPVSIVMLAARAREVHSLRGSGVTRYRLSPGWYPPRASIKVHGCTACMSCTQTALMHLETECLCSFESLAREVYFPLRIL